MKEGREGGRDAPFCCSNSNLLTSLSFIIIKFPQKDAARRKAEDEEQERLLAIAANGGSGGGGTYVSSFVYSVLDSLFPLFF
jgi:hypothetical protein